MSLGCTLIRFHGLLRCTLGLALAGPGLLIAQTPLAATGQAPASADALPSAPAAQTDALSAWNQLLRDVARIGMHAAEANTGSASSGGPMNTSMPGESTGKMQTSTGFASDGGAVHGDSMRGGGMRGGSAQAGGMGDSRPGAGSMGAGSMGGSGFRGGSGGPGMGSGMGSGMGGGMNAMHSSGQGGMGGMGQGGPGGGSGGMGGQGRPGGSSLNLGSLFQLAGGVGRGLSASGYSGVGTALSTIPALTGGGLSLPMNSSVGNFRFAYQSPLNFSGMNGTALAMHGYGSGVAAYDSPHARSGRVDFSASALMGMSASSGAGGGGGQGGGMGHGGPGGPGGHGGGGGQTQPSASVSLHLSF